MSGYNDDCITPEMPYFPSCPYGLVIFPEDAYPRESIYTEWVCTYKGEYE